jgi:hypothetical protein
MATVAPAPPERGGDHTGTRSQRQRPKPASIPDFYWRACSPLIGVRKSRAFSDQAVYQSS